MTNKEFNRKYISGLRRATQNPTRKSGALSRPEPGYIDIKKSQHPNHKILPDGSHRHQKTRNKVSRFCVNAFININCEIDPKRENFFRVSVIVAQNPNPKTEPVLFGEPNRTQNFQLTRAETRTFSPTRRKSDTY